jgi:site-specific DNA-methyltransferase (adenine-specific)
MTDLPINKIVCGDNVATMATFPAESIDLVVTSPPYDNLRTYSAGKPIDQLWDFEGVAQELWRVIKPGGVVIWVVADATVNGSETGTSFRQALRFMEIGFRLHDTMIYARDGCRFPETNRYYPIYEYMFVFSKDTPASVNLIEDRKNLRAGDSLNSCTQREKDGSLQAVSASRVARDRVIKEYGVRFNIWTYSCGNGKSTSDKSAFEHPAIFPEALARDHILSWSNEGDIVLDPFSGSGTTAKMAKHNGRQYIGIEVNPEYVEISLKRLEQQVFEF